MRTTHILKLRPGRAFTLVEILVVLAIMSILIAFSVPALEPAVRGSKLKQAADDLERALATAQQYALAENTTVQFRFYNYDDKSVPGSEQYFRGYRALVQYLDPKDHRNVIESEETTVVDTVAMPQPFVIADDGEMSSLVSNSGLMEGTEEIARSTSADYRAFEFRPDGSTNLITVDEDFWTLTVLRETDTGSELPDEFVTLVLDPFNGQVRRYQR